MNRASPADTKTHRNMRESLLIGFHAVACAQFAFAIYYDYTYTIVPREVAKMHSAYGGKFKFLTFWDAIIQALFFFVCLLNDFHGTNKVNPEKAPFIRKLKDYVHGAFSFPLAMFVGLTFWSIWWVDRELVLPRALDPYFPWWLNHLMHTMIMVATLLEMLISPRQYPNKCYGLGGLLLLQLVYLIWMHVIYMKSGIWVYPIMDVLSPPVRIAFFLVLFGVSALLYFAGETLDRLVWGNEHSKRQASHKKSK